MHRKWSIIELVNEATRYLQQKGIKSPRLDAELLLSHILGTDRMHLYINYDAIIQEGELSLFRELIKRRAEREPVAYLTGVKDFWSLKIDVDKDVLIPRPETELLVEESINVIKAIVEINGRAGVLELGIGSGAVSVALAKEISELCVIATDISYAAAKIARSNAEKQGLAEKIHFVCGNSLTFIKRENLFDVIIANPPYVRSGDIRKLEPEVANHEPTVALDGGVEGLDFYRNWIPEMAYLVKKGGWIILEMGTDQSSAIYQIFDSTEKYTDIKTVKDYAKIKRVIRAKRR